MRLSHNKIFLLGMPGSGKSTLGHSLSSELSVDYYDLDNEVEVKENRSIADIFKMYGEDYFRKSESDNLNRLIDTNDSFVLSTGGGTPCFFNNLEVMNKAGMTIFLNVSKGELMDRLLSTDLAKRPKFGDKRGLSRYLDKVYDERFEVYQKASIIISDDNIEIEHILNELKLR